MGVLPNKPCSPTYFYTNSFPDAKWRNPLEQSASHGEWEPACIAMRTASGTGKIFQVSVCDLHLVPLWYSQIHHWLWFSQDNINSGAVHHPYQSSLIFSSPEANLVTVDDTSCSSFTSPSTVSAGPVCHHRGNQWTCDAIQQRKMSSITERTSRHVCPQDGSELK